MRVAAIVVLAAGLASAEPDEQALEWLRKAQQRAGGADVLAAVRDVRLERHMRNAAAGLTAEQTLVYVLPGALRQQSALPFGKVTVFVDAEGGWMHGPRGQAPLPPPQLRQVRGELFRLREALLLADRLDDREVRFVREADDGARQAAVLEVASKDGDERVEIWIDRETGELYKLVYAGVALAGTPPQVEERHRDFRVVEGVRIPHKITIRQGGAVVTDVAVVEVSVNSGVSEEELAAKP